jgi:geranylgeranyl diphosphate synthase type I
VTLATYQDRYLPFLEAELKDALECEGVLVPYYGMLQYHMGWLDADLNPVGAPSGKRLRPVLCLLSCEAVDGAFEQALPAAAAIELVHNFSLIHDDIEDQSDMRRHRTALWRLWGLPHGINSGDGMFAAAFLKLSQLRERGVPLRRALEAQRVFAQTCLTVTEGQYLDMAFETQAAIDLEGYLSMVRRKTAALIACSTRLGALLGGADLEIQDAYARFGENLGLAFQVVDDILGIWGDEEHTGKSTSSDILTRKKTLPIVYALGDEELQQLYAQEHLSEQDVDRVVSLLDRHQARLFAQNMARQYSEEALRCLSSSPERNAAHHALREHTLSLLSRTM